MASSNPAERGDGEETTITPLSASPDSVELHRHLEEVEQQVLAALAAPGSTVIYALEALESLLQHVGMQAMVSAKMDPRQYIHGGCLGTSHARHTGKRTEGSLTLVMPEATRETLQLATLTTPRNRIAKVFEIGDAIKEAHHNPGVRLTATEIKTMRMFADPEKFRPIGQDDLESLIGIVDERDNLHIPPKIFGADQQHRKLRREAMQRKSALDTVITTIERRCIVFAAGGGICSNEEYVRLPEKLQLLMGKATWRFQTRVLQAMLEELHRAIDDDEFGTADQAPSYPTLVKAPADLAGAMDAYVRWMRHMSIDTSVGGDSSSGKNLITYIRQSLDTLPDLQTFMFNPQSPESLECLRRSKEAGKVTVPGVVKRAKMLLTSFAQASAHLTAHICRLTS